jgi:hypothetical protein
MRRGVGGVVESRFAVDGMKMGSKDGLHFASGYAATLHPEFPLVMTTYTILFSPYIYYTLKQLASNHYQTGRYSISVDDS